MKAKTGLKKTRNINNELRTKYDEGKYYFSLIYNEPNLIYSKIKESYGDDNYIQSLKVQKLLSVEELDVLTLIYVYENELRKFNREYKEAFDYFEKNYTKNEFKKLYDTYYYSKKIQSIRDSVYFWGDFTGPNQMGIATPPTGINWVNNGFTLTDNDDWTVAQVFRPTGNPTQQQYLNCGAGICVGDSAALTPNTLFFIFVGTFNGTVVNTVMSLGWGGTFLDRWSTGFCFANGDVGSSAITKVKNIEQVGSHIKPEEPANADSRCS
jgi:hypothetical protein